MVLLILSVFNVTFGNFFFQSERKFNSRLYDLKDRLEQAHCTNRSMQNYVQFLKNSYANVFGDSASGLPSTAMPSTSNYPF